MELHLKDFQASALTGTVTKTAGSTTLAGAGTAFLSEVAPGTAIIVPGTATEIAIVATVASNTSLTTQAPFENSAGGQTASKLKHYGLVSVSEYHPFPVRLIGEGGAAANVVDTELPAARLAAHGLSLPTAPDVIAVQARYNSSTLDLETGNVALGVGITAAGVTTTQTGSDLTNHNARGVKVVLDMTNVGTGSVTLSIQGKDATSGKYFTILTGAAVVTNSTNVYTVYPGVTAAANAAVSDILPRTWRVVVTANNANPTTYTVGACLVV